MFLNFLAKGTREASRCTLMLWKFSWGLYISPKQGWESGITAITADVQMGSTMISQTGQTAQLSLSVLWFLFFLLKLRVSFTENSYTFGTWLRCGPWGLHPLLHFYGNLWILLTMLPISSCNCRSLIGHSFIHSQFLTYLFWTKQDFIWSLFISMILVSLPTKQPLNHNLCLRSREWPFQEAWMENPL